MSNRELLNTQRAALGLDAAFYHSAEIFKIEQATWLRCQWIVVAHANELDAAGGRLTRHIAGSEILLTRDQAGAVRAFFNLCPDRLRRLCPEQLGCSSIVCPCHGWRFDLNGRIVRGQLGRGTACPNRLHLSPAPLVVVGGLVLCGLSDIELPEPTRAIEMLEPILGGHSLASARVPARRVRFIRANWKRVLEALLQGDVSVGGRNWARLAGARGPHPGMPAADFVEGARVDSDQDRTSATPFKEAVRESGGDNHLSLRVFRRRLGARRLTLSRDGGMLCQPMGRLRHGEGGQTIIHLGSLSFLVAYDDHVVLIQVNPVGARTTELALTWMVADDEPLDCGVRDLCWAWEEMAQDDLERLEQGRGLNSPAHQAASFGDHDSLFANFAASYLEDMRQVFEVHAENVNVAGSAQQEASVHDNSHSATNPDSATRRFAQGRL